MVSLLVAIIYLAFISLGLPDSLLGSAWPVMRPELGVPLSYAGIIYMIITGGTIVSALLSDMLTRKLSAGLVTAASTLLTAAALLGFSVSGSFWMLCVLAVPYGLGAGAIDAALNNYVALNYSSRHMHWLHSFWGVGASISPYIMGYCLTGSLGWAGGYRTVALIQIGITAVLFLSLPMWKKRDGASTGGKGGAGAMKPAQILKIKGVKLILPAFFCYCAIEGTAGLWASSFLAGHRSFDPESASRYASLVFLGITGGRFLGGFISNKTGDRNMIRIGIAVTMLGIIAVWLPAGSDLLCLAGLIVIGLGCAPVYPAIIHSTPVNFGKENSQAIIGMQMASTYTGMALMPPLFGVIANNISISLYPGYLLVITLFMLLLLEKFNIILSRRRAEHRR